MVRSILEWAGLVKVTYGLPNKEHQMKQASPRPAQTRRVGDSQLMSDPEVDLLAQVIRKAHVMTQIGSHSGFTITPWGELVGREKAPYVASAIAAIRHFRENANGK